MFFFKKNKNLKAFLTGELVSIDKVNDDVFSQKMMGDGIAIKPNDDKIYSPCDGTVEVVFEGSEHAIGIVMDNGLQVMIHCGLNTVNLTGTCSSKVKKGDKVKAGQLIMTFDREKLKEENCDDITMLVVLDQGEAKSITFVGDQNVVANETEIAQIA
jgi:PTS system glucose-specific IIA component